MTDLPEKTGKLLNHAMQTAVEWFQEEGNHIVPVVHRFTNEGEPTADLVDIYHEGTKITDPTLVTKRVLETLKKLVADGAELLIVTYEGYFEGTSNRYLKTILYSRETELTWLAPVNHRMVGEWQQVLIKSGDLHDLFWKADAYKLN